MSEHQSYLAHVGYVLLPRTPDDLGPDRCPACFAALAGPVCSVCGLDLGHPEAPQLRDAMARLCDDLDRRLHLIGRIRFETAQRQATVAQQQAQQPSTAAAAATTVSAPAAPPTPIVPPVEPVHATPAQAPAAAPPAPAAADPTFAAPAPAATTPAAPRRGFGVQGVLLTVGAVLLSVAAIFFLIFAFVVFDTLGRGLIILAITTAAIIGATLLKGRRLPAAAEAIAAVGVVLVYLDAWALRELTPWVASIPGETFWGAVLVLSAVGFALWHRASRIRTPNIAAFLAIAPGVGLIALEPAQPHGAAFATFVFMLGMAVGGFAHAVLGRTPDRAAFERMTVLSVTTLGLVGAGVAAPFMLPRADWAPAVGLLLVAAVALAHLAVAHRVRRPVFGHVFAALGAVAAASSAAATVPRIDSEPFALIAPPVVAVVVALAFEGAARRPGLRRSATVGAWSAAGVAVLAALPALVVVVARLGLVAGHPTVLGAWSVSGDFALQPNRHHVPALIALAVVVVIATIAWAVGRRLPRRGVVVASAVAALLLLAAPALGMLWLIVVGWSTLALVALAALIARTPTLARYRGALAVTAALATLLAFTASWASEDTWLAGTLVTIVVLLGARLAVRGDSAAAPRAALLGGAAAVALGGAGALGAWLGDDPAAPAQFAAALAIALVGVAAFALPSPVTALDRRVAFWVALPVGTATAVATWRQSLDAVEAPLLPQPLTGIALAVAAVAVLGVWMLRRPERGMHAERFVASMLATPALAWALDAVLRATAAPDQVLRLALAVAVVVCAAASLAIAVRRRTDDARFARDGAVALTALAAVVLVAATDALWITLLLVAVSVLLVAISRDGLFASRSPRRHLGWVALALATAGLWARLAESNVTVLEPYVLPLTGMLLVVAVLVARARDSAAGPWIAFGGLLVAILPLGAAGASDEPLRAAVVASVSAVLLLAGSLVLGSASIRRWLDVFALAGAIGVIVAAIGRALLLTVRGTHATAEPEAWLGGAVLVLIVAAFGFTRSRTDAAARIRLIAAQTLGVIALASVFAVEAFAMDATRVGTLRALATVLLFAAVHVIAMIVRRAPLTATVAWASLGLGAAATALGITVGAFDPLELGTVPLAVALLATGSIAMLRTPHSRSWPNLSAGLLVLLVPSLAATFVDAPPWRLVALGVVAVALVAIGAIARLQAPLVLGAVMAIVHAVRTFAPQLVAVYEATPWWLWAAVGGALLLFLGITFEKRRRDAKAFVAAIARLR